MSIITGRGDDGTTDLLFGRRMAKSSLRAEALGTIDELNAAIGLARAAADDETLTGWLDGIQERLFGLMGELAHEQTDARRYDAKKFARITPSDVEWIEQLARAEEARGVRFTGWAKPGAAGSLARAALDFARTAARRAERTALRLHEDGINVPQEVRIFLNRLSDLLWILARRDDAAGPAAG